MRIGITCYPTWGGSGVVAAELGMALAKTGHEVHFISYAPPSRLDGFQPGVFFHEVEVTTYPLFQFPPYSLALATKMAEVAETARLDILHVHYAIPHAVSAHLAKEMLAPHEIQVVTTLHGTDVTLVGNDRSYLPITRFSIERSDGATAVSEYLRRVTHEVLGVQRAIEVIPNFIVPERYLAAKERRAECGLARPGTWVLMHISNFRPVKRVHDVIAVFDRIRQHGKARLIMVGDGPERSAAEAECQRLGLGSSVLFVGSVQRVEDLLACADLFLLPSETESFGLAALEAMSCEVPVIASRAGGLPEVVVDGETGFLREVGDVEAMAAAALEILQSPERRREMGRRGREVAVERFSVERVLAQYTGCYQRLLGG